MRLEGFGSIKSLRTTGVVVTNGWSSGKRHCYQCRQGWIQWRCGGCIPPPAIFKHVFNEYNFSKISTFSIAMSLNYAQSTHNRKCTKCIIFGETLGYRSKKFKQNLPKNCLKSIKMTTTVCKFSKILRGSMPPDPLESFYFQYASK